MTINILFFDYKEYEKPFFRDNALENFNITFFEESLNKDSVKNIPEEIKDKTTIIVVFTDSNIDKEVINSFKNLRIISTRSNTHGHICKKSANERNIAVFNIKFSNDENPQEQSEKILHETFKQIRDALKGKNIYGSI